MEETDIIICLKKRNKKVFYGFNSVCYDLVIHH